MRGTGHGKLILFGEHFVVYGEPAIVTGIEHVLRVVVRRNDVVELWPPSWDDGKAREAVQTAISHTNIGTGLKVKVFSEFPAGAGLGASGAFCVAVSRALGVEDVLGLSHEMEKSFHGRPSGIDTAAAYYGRTLLFRGRNDVEPLPEAGVWVVAIYSGDRERSVKELVEGVKKLREENPRWFSRVTSSYREICRRAVEGFIEGDAELLGRLMDRNHQLLREIGVSSGRIERAVRFLKGMGALGAKLTGGGDGGFVIGLFDTKRGAREACKSARNFRHVVLTRV